MTDNAWIDALQPASFRGQPFAVLSDEFTAGRRFAVHEYPMRDEPWIEDLGKATRKLQLNGFLISDSLIYSGGSAIDQYQALVVAAETKGSGKLVHPILGELQVAGVTATLVNVWENGRYIEFRLQAFASGARLFPTATSSTQDVVASAATTSNTAAASDFSTAATPQLNLGALTSQQALSAVQGWAGQVTNLIGDATSIYRLAAGLPGAFGRFINGALAGGLGGVFQSPYSAVTTVEDLILAATGTRAAIQVALTNWESAAATLGAGLSSTTPLDLASLAQGVIAELGGASADPADAVRNLTSLATNPPVLAPTPVGAAIADLMRRGAVTALAQAATAYQPASYNDAASLRALIAGLIDDEIDIAGDQGADDTFNALRALRSATVLDLTARGATLAPMKTFSFNTNLPVISLAQRLYQDADRADGLLTQIDCPHPLFAPTTFQALAA